MPAQDQQRPADADIGVPSFGDFSDAYVEAMAPSWRNPKHAAQWKMTLTVYAQPLRHRPVDAMTDALVENNARAQASGETTQGGASNDDWCRDLVTRTGDRFEVRPAGPSDEAELASFFGRDTDVDRSLHG